MNRNATPNALRPGAQERTADALRRSTKTAITWSYTSWILGASLIIAAALKARAPWAILVFERFGEYQRTIVILGVLFETFLGFCLILCPAVRAVRYACLATFVLFALIAFSEFLSGSSSCGCFGTIQVPPFSTAVFDAVAAVAIGVTLRGESSRIVPRFAGVRRKLIVATVMGLLAAGVALGRMSSAYDVDGVTMVGETAVVSATKLIGNRFALSRYSDFGDRLLSGKWLVLVFRADCAHCVSILPRFRGLKLPDGSRLCLLEVPSSETAHRSEATDVAMHLNLRRGREWVIGTPLLVQVSEGVVIRAESQEAAEEWLRALEQGECHEAIIGQAFPKAVLVRAY